MPITIRQVRREDNKKLAQIIREVFIEYSAEKEGTVYSDPSTDNLHELFLVKNATLWVAELEGEIMGCCGIFPTKGLPQACVELVKFYLHQKGRGQGLGRALMKQCIDSASKFGFRSVYIESLPEFKEAVGIYEKQGFKRLDKALTKFGHPGCTLWFYKGL